MGIDQIETQVLNLISKHNLKRRISLQDIKDMIWNSKISEFNIIIGKILEICDSKNEGDIIEIMKVISSAWNSFPHKALDGLSPNEKVQGNKTQTNNNKRAKSKTITKVFKDTYPSNLTFRKQQQNNWVYDFPRNYYDLIDEIEAIENNEKLTPKKYQDKLLDILEAMPYQVYAAVSLADFYQCNGEVALARNCYEITLKEYLNILPPKFKGLIPWGYLNNREFLRLLHGYGLLLLASGDTIGSEVIFEQLIRFNPNDNQGIREILMNIYVSTVQTEKALNLAKSYPDDSMAGLILGEVLTLYIINKRDKAKRILKKNSQRLSNVFIEIFKKKHMQPKDIEPGFVTYKGQDEAYYYWCDQGYLWDKIEGAKPWLKETLDGFLL